LFPELLQFNIQKSKTRNPVILNFEFFRQTENSCNAGVF